MLFLAPLVLTVAAVLEGWSSALSQGAPTSSSRIAHVPDVWYHDPVAIVLGVLALFVLVDLVMMFRQLRSHARRTRLI